MKTIITIILFAAIFTMLTACTQSNDIETGNNATTITQEDFGDFGQIEPAPITIWHYELNNSDFRTEIIDTIIFSAAYVKEFYFPRKIDRFELFCVSIYNNSLNYFFAPSEKIEDYVFDNTTGIEVIISRPFDAGERKNYANITEYFDELVRDNSMTLIGDNIAYAGDGHLFGIIGDTIFRISAPVGMRDQDTLIALARDLISTAELVNVDEEIGRLAAE
jgi:hypothetical protein